MENDTVDRFAGCVKCRDRAGPLWENDAPCISRRRRTTPSARPSSWPRPVPARSRATGSPRPSRSRSSSWRTSCPTCATPATCRASGGPRAATGWPGRPTPSPWPTSSGRSTGRWPTSAGPGRSRSSTAAAPATWPRSGSRSGSACAACSSGSPWPTWSPASCRPRSRSWSATPTPGCRAGPRCLGEGGQAGDGLAQDQAVDLAGALVGEHRLEVVGVAHDRVLEGDAVGAEDRAGAAGDGQGLADVVELAQADLLGGEAALVLHAAQVQGQQGALGQLDQHVGQLLLGELEAADRAVELDPGGGVFQRALEAGPGRAHRPPAEPVAGLVEARPGAAHAADLGEHGVGGQPAALPHQLGGDRGAQAELAFDVAGGEAG